MRIGVDIDDVLYPWYEKAHELCVEAGITNGKEPNSWAPFEQYGCSDEVWYDVLALSTLDGRLYDAPPYPGVLAALVRLQGAGHTIHLVTARGFLWHGELIREQTVKWLNGWKVPHDSLTFSKRKSVVHTDYFIDDSEKNVNELEGLLGGPRVYLMDQPHNRHFEHPRRVKSFVEFADIIHDHTAQEEAA